MQYQSLKCKNQKKLYSSLIKYGFENHTFEIIERCTSEDLNKRERYWQEFYDSVEHGLNLIYTKTDEKYQIFSKETRQKMSQAKLGKRHSIETCQKISQAKLGKPRSEETRQKMSQAKKNISSETRQKMSQAKLGKPRSEETRAKISTSRKKRIIDITTGMVYDSPMEINNKINMKYSTLAAMLSGNRKNKTNYRYLD